MSLDPPAPSLPLQTAQVRAILPAPLLPQPPAQASSNSPSPIPALPVPPRPLKSTAPRLLTGSVVTVTVVSVTVSLSPGPASAMARAEGRRGRHPSPVLRLRGLRGSVSDSERQQDLHLFSPPPGPPLPHPWGQPVQPHFRPPASGCDAVGGPARHQLHAAQARPSRSSAQARRGRRGEESRGAQGRPRAQVR